MSGWDSLRQRLPVWKLTRAWLAISLSAVASAQTLPPSGPVWTDWVNIPGFYETGQDVCDARAIALWGSNDLGVYFTHVPPDVPRCNIQGGTIAYPYLGYYCPVGTPVTPDLNQRYWWFGGLMPGLVYKTISDCTLPVQTSDKLSCDSSSDSGDSACPGRGRTFLGNPIDLAVGAKLERVTNLPRSPDMGWGFQVAYIGSRASTAFKVATGYAAPRAPLIGRGWTGTFFQRVVELGAGAYRAAYVIRPTGDVYFFNRIGSAYTATADLRDRLEERLGTGGQPTGWRYHVNRDGSVEEFDLQGRLERVNRRDGLQIQVTYTGATMLPIAVTDSLGKRIELEYRPNGTLSVIRDRAGGLTTFEQDTSGRLTRITFPDQMSRSFNYSTDGNYDYWQFLLLTAVTDENGSQYSTFSYDGGGALSTSLVSGVRRYQISRVATPSQGDLQGITTVTDPLGVVRTFRYRVIHGAPFVTDVAVGSGELPCPQCGPKRREYDANANLIATTDWNDGVTQHRYDLTRNVEIGRTEGLKNRAGSIVTTADTRTVTTSWHAMFRLPFEVKVYSGGVDAGGNPTGALLKTTRHTYDAFGNLTRRDEIAGAATRTWRYTHTTYGRVLTATDPNNRVTSYSYHLDNDPDLGKRGNVTSITNAANHTIYITDYNAHGQPTRIVDPNGVVTVLTYDPRLRLTSRSVGTEATVFGYDPVGQMTSVNLPDGARLTYAYDAAHRLTAINDHKGNRIDYTLDAMGNRITEQMKDPGGVLVGNIARVIDALNRVQQVTGAGQ